LRASQRIPWIVLAAACLIVVVQFAGVWLLLDAARQSTVHTAGRLVERVARAAESAINRGLLESDAALVGLSALLPAAAGGRSFDAAAASRILRELDNQSFLIRDILVLGAEPIPLAAAQPSSLRRPLLPPLQPMVRGLQPGALAVSNPVINPATAEWAVFLMRSSEIAGIGPATLLLEVQVSSLAALLAGGTPVAGIRLSLERADGTLMASVPHDEGRISLRVPERPADAGTLIETVRPTLYAGLRVVAAQDTLAALAEWRQDRDRALLISLGFGALVLLLAGFLVWVLRARAQATVILDRALESMSDGFALFDAQDRLLACNRRYVELFPHLAEVAKPGVHFRTLAARAAMEVMDGQSPETREAWVQWRTEEHAKRESRPFRQALSDGRVIDSIESPTPDGGAVAVFRDATGAKRAEDELARAKQAAEAASAAKTRFLTTMSHEIRTPLNAVLGMAGLLLETRLDDDQRRHVEIIRNEGDHLLTLLNDILDLSKLEADQIELERIVFDPNRLTHDAISLAGARAAAKGLRLEVVTAPELPQAVAGDPGRLRQVLVNLISNAVKFTEQGGVTIRVRQQGQDGETVHVTWSVSDTGIGIPPDRLAMLFQPFVQADNSIARRFGGTGLGLSICRRLVDLMGGTIEVASEVGRGTAFHFTLPLRCAEVPLDAAPSDDPRAGLEQALAGLGRPLRILLAEDNQTNQLVAISLLRHPRIRVDVVGNGIEAIEATERLPYDMILMDVQMPEMDGLTATRLLRGRPGRPAQIPIVAFTANVFREDVDACIAAGMNDYVSKPLRKDMLISAVLRQFPRQPGRAAAAPPPPPDRAEGPEDFAPAAIDALIADLTAPVAAEIVGSFLEDAERRLGRLPDLLAQPRQLLVEVHALKSAAGMVGAAKLSAAAGTLEIRLRDRQVVAAEELAALAPLYRAFRAALEARAPFAAVVQ